MKRSFIRLTAILAAILLLVSCNLPAKAVNFGTWQYYVSDGEATITGYTSDLDIIILSVPQTIDGYPVTAIGGNAFSGYSKLQHIDIPEGVTTIGAYAFSDCTSLTWLYLPRSITFIGANAFNNCSMLTNVDLYSGLKTIGSRAFRNCSVLKKVAIPETVTEIGDYPFTGCSNLQLICTIKNTAGARYIESIGYDEVPSGYVYGDFWYYKSVNNGAVITHYAGNSANVEIPTYIDGREVRSTTVGAFSWNPYVKHVKLSDKMQYVNGSTFFFCTELESVQLPEGLHTIWHSAFEGCLKLRDINFPSSLTTIGNYSFQSCSALESAILPSKVNSLGIASFDSCTSLKEVYLPEGITELKVSVFNDCESLTSINIPFSVKKINGWALGECASLRYLYVPATVTTITSAAFIGNYDMVILTEQNSAAQAHAEEWDDPYHAFPSQWQTDPAVPGQEYRICINCTAKEVRQAPGPLTMLDSSVMLNRGDVVYLLQDNLSEYDEIDWSTSDNTVASANQHEQGVYVFAGRPGTATLTGKHTRNVPVQYLGTGTSTIYSHSILPEKNTLECEIETISVPMLTIPESVQNVEQGAFAGTAASIINLRNLSSTIFADDAFEGCTNVTHVYLPESAVLPEGIFNGNTDILLYCRNGEQCDYARRNGIQHVLFDHDTLSH